MSETSRPPAGMTRIMKITAQGTKLQGSGRGGLEVKRGMESITVDLQVGRIQKELNRGGEGKMGHGSNQNGPGGVAGGQRV